MLALLDLPDELLVHVALQCDDVVDVSRFARTCTALHALITRTDHLWQQLLHVHYGSARVCDVHASPCDHRSLYRAHCERLTWVWPTSSAAYLSHADGDARRVRMACVAGDGSFFLSRAAYSMPPLPCWGLSAVSVLTNDVGMDVALLAYDRARDGAWDGHVAPEGVLRMHMYSLGGTVTCYPPKTGPHGLSEYGPAVYQPTDWRCGVPPSTDGPSVRRLYVAVDADRGRVYLAQGTSERWLIAFDDARLARLSNLRVSVTLWNKTWAHIERVRMTNEMRAALHALDAEYAAARRAPAEE